MSVFGKSGSGIFGGGTSAAGAGGRSDNPNRSDSGRIGKSSEMTSGRDSGSRGWGNPTTITNGQDSAGAFERGYGSTQAGFAMVGVGESNWGGSSGWAAGGWNSTAEAGGRTGWGRETDRESGSGW